LYSNCKVSAPITKEPCNSHATKMPKNVANTAQSGFFRDDFVGVAKTLKAALNVPVLCTLAGEDAFLDAIPDPYRDRAFELIHRRANDVDGFIAPTRYYAARAVEHFGLDQARVHYVPMGIRIDDVGQPADPPRDPFTIGYLAGICPEKGLAALCEAFKLLTRGPRPCRLRIAGYVGAVGRKYWAEIRRGLRRQGLLEAVDFLGEVTRAEKLSFLRSLHVLSVPTVHPEPKGFYILEAMASGVPVVQPRHGSFPELVDATGGGQLYDPPNPQALADAIAGLMENETLRKRLAADGRAAVRGNFSDDVMAEKTWSLYEQFSGGSDV
ncbi:MAG: glycosyltransferase family 4 protein, partial [Planctomycetes bacterium]|nr:glycosyltransferase family 4 protein [Planctomycetota bacterium]